MFDGLFGKKFTNKCKHAIKRIGMRMLTIRKKKDAMLRFSRKDVADLITNGLDENAFSRMDSLISDMNHVLCYDMIAKSCEYVAIQLPSLQKQRECPPEAMEAVSTLIFAAARFSDLPELCDLRRLFTERYGSHMESFVNPEFVEKIQTKSFPVDKKLQVMQEIAQEFSVTWNCKTFGQKKANFPEPIMDQPKKQKSMCNGNNESKHNGNSRKEVDMNMGNEDIPFKGRLESTPKCTAQKQVQPEPRDIHVPKSTVRKQVQPEPRDIHVVSSISNGQSRGYTGKARKVLPEDPKDVESVNMDNAFRSYVKPKGRENGSEKDDKGGIASSRSSWAKAGKVFAKEPENIEPIKTEAHPYVKPKGGENRSEMNEQLKEGSTYNQSPWTKTEPGLIGLAREVVGPDKAVSMVTPYTISNGSKAEIHVDEHHEDHFAYRMQFAAERLGPMEQEKQPVARANSKNARPLSTIPPPYVKPNATNPEAHDRFIGGESKNHLRDELYGVEKPKPFSVRRRQTKEQAAAEIESTTNNGNSVSQTSNGRKMHAGQQRAPAYEYGTDDREKMREADPKLPSGNEADYIVGDRHVRRIPSGSRHVGGQSTPANGECEVDEEENSKKGKYGDSSRMRGSQRTSLTEVVNVGMVAAHHSHDKVHHGTRSFHPLRVASLPLEPISPKETKGVAHASSMQPDGRRCPRIPDYEELAARMNALRNARNRAKYSASQHESCIDEY